MRLSLTVAGQAWPLVVYASSRTTVTLTWHRRPWVTVQRCTGPMRAIVDAIDAEHWEPRRAARNPSACAAAARARGAVVIDTSPPLVVLPLSEIPSVGL